jgi:hypothetical protein
MKTSRACKTLHAPKKFVLRLPPTVHEKIFLTAKHHRRSMNAEIIHHLERILASSTTAQIKSLPTNSILVDEEHCLSLLRALPTHKHAALVTLLESLAG